MTIVSVTTFDDAGAVIAQTGIEIPDAPTPDLPTLADQVTNLNDAVQMLILNALGV